jgi:diadenylate cyclase
MLEWFQERWQDPATRELLWTLVDYAVVYFIIYRALLLIKGTRAVQMLVGLILLIGLFFISQKGLLGLETVHWLLEKFIGSFIFIIVVLFQKDIRRALVEVGKNPILSGKANPSAIQWYEEIIRAVVNLSQKRIGAVIVIERETDLSEYAQQGVQLDAEVSKELLFAVFIPKYQNSLHDGALLIQNSRVSAASCYLPLSDAELERSLGSRHRAAVGLSEETDAVVLVVSEETGTISMASGGGLLRDLDANSLREELQRLFAPRKRRRWWHRRRPTVVSSVTERPTSEVRDAVTRGDGGAAPAGDTDFTDGARPAEAER